MTATCPQCALSVPANARVCPHCRHVLARWRRWLVHPLVQFGPIWGIMVLSLLLPSVMLWRVGLSAQRHYPPYWQSRACLPTAAAVQVTETRLFLTALDNQPCLLILGQLTNHHRTTVSRVWLHVTLYDRQGQVCDTLNDHPARGPIPVGATVAYRVAVPREFGHAEYDSVRVTVTAAD